MLEAVRDGQTLTIGGESGESCVMDPPGTVKSDLFGIWTFSDRCQVVQTEAGGTLTHWSQGDEWTFNSDGTMSMTRDGQQSSSEYQLTGGSDVVIDDDANLLKLEIGTTVTGNRLTLASVDVVGGADTGVPVAWDGDCTLAGL